MAVNAKRHHRGLLAGIGLLILFLALQIVLAKRDELAENPAWRPLISRLCLLASCQLEAWRQPEAFVPVQQAVAADPEREYREVILPAKLRLSADYAARAGLASDLKLIARTLSRVLRHLRERSLISGSGRTVNLVDPGGLRSLAGV